MEKQRIGVNNLAVSAASSRSSADMYNASEQFEDAALKQEYADRIKLIINGRRKDLYRPSY